MSMLRVVVYAEGAGELTGWDASLPRVPTTPLTENELGAAHLLVRRCIVHARGLAPKSIRFKEPLRCRGSLAKGSMLHSPKTLRPLLSWAKQEQQPDLAIVLVDADGKAEERHKDLDQALDNLLLETLAAVAIQEFEAWLLADPKALEAVFHKPLALTKPPERLARREAKKQLTEWCEQHGRKRDPAELRRLLAEQCDLETLSRACPAFARFLEGLQSPRA